LVAAPFRLPRSAAADLTAPPISFWPLMMTFACAAMTLFLPCMDKRRACSAAGSLDSFHKLCVCLFLRSQMPGHKKSQGLGSLWDVMMSGNRSDQWCWITLRFICCLSNLLNLQSLPIGRARLRTFHPPPMWRILD